MLWLEFTELSVTTLSNSGADGLNALLSHAKFSSPLFLSRLLLGDEDVERFMATYSVNINLAGTVKKVKKNANIKNIRENLQ